jgi:Domain of unknown function (DUF4279)
MESEPLMRAAIYLRGQGLDPGRVSEELGVVPSSFQKKGEPKPRSPKYIARIGVWRFDVESKSRPFAELIDELFKRIGHPTVPLDRIPGVEDAHLDILFAFGDEAKHTVEFRLTKAQLAKATELGLSICVTVM